MDATPTHNNIYRTVIGVLAMLSGIIGLFALYAFEVPAGNREPLLVALGVVLGWGSNVVQAEFGGTSAGHKLADRLADQIKP